MATWGDLCAYIRSRYIVARDERGWLGMVWKFRVDDVEIEQQVRVDRIGAFDTDWVLVYAAVCNAENIGAVGAMTSNQH